MARLLEQDPDVAANAPPIFALGLGTSLPFAALHPKGISVRAAIARLAAEPSLRWADVQARKDVANFDNFDPVAGTGVARPQPQFNPAIWEVRFRDALTPEIYRRARANPWRMHFQFIMANDRRATYDYLMLVCGPARCGDWLHDPPGTLARFDADGRYLAAPA
jgi:hypothetical protein